MGTEPGAKKRSGGRVVVEKYPLPKDKREIERLTRQHFLVKKALGQRNFCAPVRNPAKILDVACGTGVWPLEVARHFQQAKSVVGFDKYLELTDKLQRVEAKDIPANLSFQEVDALKPLPYEDGEFDFVHARFNQSFIELSLWPQVLGEMLRVLRSVGWIELAEAELSKCEGPLVKEMNQALTQLKEKLGHGFVAPQLATWLRERGVKKVKHRRVLLGGKEAANIVAEATRSYAPALLHHRMISKERLDAISAGFEAEALVYNFKLPVVIAWGQKP